MLGNRQGANPDVLSASKLTVLTEYIEEHIGHNITLSRFAELSGLSISRFCHAFRNSTGFTPHQYVLHRRIELAKLHLRNGNAKVDLAELAVELGFSSQSHFTRAFRVSTGTTPRRYRDDN
jgi:AraC family transcriptional regulator